MALKEISIKDLDRKAVSTIVLVFVIIVAFLWGWQSVGSKLKRLERQVESKKADLESFKNLGADYLKKRAMVDAVSKKAYASVPSGGIITAIEDMGKAIGAEGRITGVKPLGERTTLGYTERDFEARLERVDLNQVINLLYMIENNKTLFLIKEFSFDSRFEDPNQLDITLKLTHVSKLPTP